MHDAGLTVAGKIIGGLLGLMVKVSLGTQSLPWQQHARWAFRYEEAFWGHLTRNPLIRRAPYALRLGTL
jgi:hypothetical protein